MFRPLGGEPPCSVEAMHEARPGGGQDEVVSSARQEAPASSVDWPDDTNDASAGSERAHGEVPGPDAEAAAEQAPGGEERDYDDVATSGEVPTSDEVTAEGPRPLGVGVQPTGHSEIDAQLRRLSDVDHLAVSGHLEVYEDVHRGLRSTLTALDQHNPGS